MRSHFLVPWNTVFEDPGSFGSWRCGVLSMHLTHALCSWLTLAAKYPKTGNSCTFVNIAALIGKYWASHVRGGVSHNVANSSFNSARYKCMSIPVCFSP